MRQPGTSLRDLFGFLPGFLPGFLVAALVIVGASPAAQAGVTVAPITGDHMVIQRGRPVPLSGSDAPGQTIRATLATARATTRTDAAGHWSLALPAPAAGGPFTLTVEGSTVATFTDIWSGEVWVASGQSNMELPLRRSSGAGEAVAGGCPGLRLFIVPQRTAVAPAATVDGKWQPCDAVTAAGFSAVAFHFGRELHRALGVPVGLILAAQGGTPAEAWTPREALVADPALRPMVDAFDAAVRDPAQRAELEQRRAAWEAKNFHQDRGNRGEALGFARPRGGGARWATIDLPQVWESAGLPIDGAVWFRREVTLPAEWAGRDLALSLGALDDFDVTYWNGQRVGATGAETPNYWSAPRHYTVPGRLARAGTNLIAVRIFDHYGSGGFAGAPAELTVGPASAPGGATTTATPTPTATTTPTTLPLAGRWSYKIERRLEPAFADFSSRPRLPGGDDPESPCVLWNGMIAPIARLPVAGVIWYQGESNVSRALQYRRLFPTMVRAWRAGWGDPALPFLFVQLPNYGEPRPGHALGDSAWADLREAQAMTLREPRTAMAVTLDIGEGDNLHPRNKQEVGRRLALGALRLVYGRETISSGPTLRSAAREGSALRVRFASIASGLDTSDGAPPRGFLIAGADQAWHPAAARIVGDSVIVSSPDVPDPVAVRYGWADDPPNSLRNQAELPAAPFRTDDWPALTASTTPLAPTP